MKQAILSVLLLLASGCASLAQQSDPVERFQTKNGLKVILRPVSGAKQAAVFVVFRIGASQDPERRSGTAHLIEHLYATAGAGETKERTADEWMAGGKANAQTGEDYTLIAEVVDPKALETALKDAAARMDALQVNDALLARERQRVLDEVTNMFGRIPPLGAFNQARERVRPTARGGRRGGAPDQLPAITLAEIRDRLKKFYKPGNATLVIAGAVDPKAARVLVEKEFAGLAAGASPPPAASPGPPQTGKTETVNVTSAFSDQAEACVVYAAPLPTDRDYPAFLLLAGRIMQCAFQPGANPSQPPALRVQYSFVEDPFVFSVGSAVRKDETGEQAISRLKTLVAAQVQRPLKPEDRIATRNLFGPLLGAIDVADAQWAANPYALALSLWYRDRSNFDPARWKQDIDALKQEDVTRCAERFFASSKSAAVVLIPKQ